MAAPLLLIGTGYDGIAGEPVLINSIDEAYSVFGGWCYEYLDLAATDVSASLSYTPSGALQFYTESGGRLESYPVFGLTVAGSGLTFEAPGEAISVVVKYMRERNASDVFNGFMEAYYTAQDSLYLLRMPCGTTATKTLSFANSSLILTAPYPGSLYNSTRTRLVTGADNYPYLGVRPPAGKGFERYYKLTGQTTQELYEEMVLDWAKGYTPIQVTFSGDATDTVSFTGSLNETFSGGTDGSVVDQDYTDLLNTLDFSGFKVVSLLGKTYIQATALLSDSLLASLPTPSLFVHGVTYDSTLTAHSYEQSIVTGSVDGRWQLSRVVGEGYFSLGPGLGYWGSLSTAYAGLLAVSKEPVLRKGIIVGDIRPVFSAADIAELGGAGYVAFTRSISGKNVVAAAATADSAASLTSVIAYTDIANGVVNLLQQYIGSTSVAREDVEAQVTALLDSSSLIRDYTCSVTFTVAPAAILVSITLYVVGEIKTISFSIGVQRNAF